MTSYIILTPQQASVVATEWGSQARLEPRELVDGTWSVPASVLTSPDYAWVRSALEQCPTREVADIEFTGYEPPEE